MGKNSRGGDANWDGEKEGLFAVCRVNALKDLYPDQISDLPTISSICWIDELECLRPLGGSASFMLCILSSAYSTRFTPMVPTG